MGLARKLGKSTHAALWSSVIQKSQRCLHFLGEGEVDRSIEVLQGCGQLARRTALMGSVNGGFEPHRAPHREQQVEFFERAYPLTRLGTRDRIKFFVALGYNAAEIGAVEAQQRAIKSLEDQLEVAQRQRSRIPFAVQDKKRGHHFYYSIMNALAHVQLSMGHAAAFDLLIDRTCAFFHEQTLRTRDKGFGWAMVNVIDLLGLASLRAIMLDDTVRQQQMTEIMHSMLRLGVQRKVGPIEWPGFYHSCARCQQTVSIGSDADRRNLEKVFGYLVRVRSEQSQQRIFLTLQQRDDDRGSHIGSEKPASASPQSDEEMTIDKP